MSYAIIVNQLSGINVLTESYSKKWNRDIEFM